MQQYQPIKEGKVRQIFDIGDKLVIVPTDRISAFDEILPINIINKGILLNMMSEFWFEFFKEHLPDIPTHMISTRPEKMPEFFWSDYYRDRSMLVKKLKMLPVECIVRGYITGSAWESYKNDGTICGIQLPKGLQESEKIQPIFTPTTKEETGHDRPISFQDLKELVGKENAYLLREYSIDLYAKAAEYAMTRDIIIADTKFEFGLDEKGILTLADEVLTPDSSRFWSAKDYSVGKPQRSFDKQFLRDWIKENRRDDGTIPEIPIHVTYETRMRYYEAYEYLTGEVVEF